MHRLARISGLSGVVMAIMVAVPYSAQAQQNDADHCIRCANPSQTYLCRLTSKGSVVQGGQMMCIMNIARQYGHDSCAATSQSSGCSGTLVVYDMQEMAPAPAAGTSSRQRPRMKAVEEYEENRKKNPDTLVDLSKKTFENTEKGLSNLGKNTEKAIKNIGDNTGKALKKTGKVLTDATKSTFNCLTSLFTNCTPDN